MLHLWLKTNFAFLDKRETFYLGLYRFQITGLDDE